MCHPMQCWMENSALNAGAVGTQQACPVPALRKAFGQWQKMDLPISRGLHFVQIQIRNDEVHFQASGAIGGVAMAIQQSLQHCEVFGGFQSVVVVWAFAQDHTRTTQMIQTFLIAQTGTSPIIALEYDNWPIKAETLDRKKFPATLPKFPDIAHATISEPKRCSSRRIDRSGFPTKLPASRRRDSLRDTM